MDTTGIGEVQVSAIAVLSAHDFPSAASRLNKPHINTGWKGLSPAAVYAP